MRMIRNEKGFTLIELIAIMMIMAILFAVAAKKQTDLAMFANDRLVQEFAKELSVREMMVWAQAKVEPSYADDDSFIFPHMVANRHYENVGVLWLNGPTPVGGQLTISGTKATLTRTPATTLQAGKWEVK